MALIDCPSCNKRISSKAPVCQHCHTVLDGTSDEQRKSMQQMARIQKHQQLMTHSMLAMLLFCGGFGFMFWGDHQPHSWQYTLSAGTTVVGFVWYVVTRVRILWAKRK
ncbi:hypothetical protein QWY77_01815 [Thalassotalea ponticola]|uniref:hypothetical protein n=1 Tax=Thalassotalea ponticola TaxID=1523392 RepID=UPI0025B56AB0|nr:hypothetical protein [Thalassotalea ponticola]MDN3651520.1 hypothetical protein [Thalassotalea ponticola]